MSTFQHSSLADMAYTQVRRKILFQELRGGDSVNELSLARQLKLGRTPIREGVLRLAREGLLRIIPRKGIIVMEMNIDTLRLVYEARSPCEVQIARLAALRSEPSDIKVMKQALAGVEQMIEERRFLDLLRADERFHMSLADAARNQLLQEMQRTLYGLGIRFWYATLPQRSPGDLKKEMKLHRDVIEGIKLRDPEKTAQAMTAIIAGFPERVADLIRGQHLQGREQA